MLARRVLAAGIGLLLALAPALGFADKSQNDIVVREVFRCLDEDGYPRAFTYHLNRSYYDYGDYTLWIIATMFDFRDLSVLGLKMEPMKMNLALIVIYDTREDGRPERLDVIEARARNVLSGTKTRITHDGAVHWGPYTIVQELEHQRFEIDHHQPYVGGSVGRVHISIRPSAEPVGDVAGFVRSEKINLINDNVRLRSCSFNRAPVDLKLR